MRYIKLWALLNRCKANSRTYYNLWDEEKRDFRKQYNHLNKNKELSLLWSSGSEKKFQRKLSSDHMDYVAKQRAMGYLNYIIN